MPSPKPRSNSKPKSETPNPIHLEGTTLEGGGQLLRIALALSSLTAIPIHVTNIRGKRSGGGGLKAQHLTSLTWLARESEARVSGAGLKSREIVFVPRRGSGDGEGPGRRNVHVSGEVGRKERERHIEIKQSTPGSVNLVFQAILPYLLFSHSHSESPTSTSPSPSPSSPQAHPSKITLRITGGTNVSNSPSIDYIQQVLLPMLQKISIKDLTASLQSRGWSQGGTKLGSVSFGITLFGPGEALSGFTLGREDRGEVVHVQATIIAPKAVEQDLREEVESAVHKRWREIFGKQRDRKGYEDGDGQGDERTKAEPDTALDITFEDSHHEKRYYLLLVATTSTGIKLGRDWLYDHGVRAGKTGKVVDALAKKVVADLVAEIAHGGCVDEWLRDQLVVFQALAKGRSEVFGGSVGGKREGEGGLMEPSLHARTAQWVVGEMLGVEFDEEGGCEGVAFGEQQDDARLADELQSLDISTA
ncbi:EPT/RTPC-like protein [Lophiostoma macrostomum CBS 122681]|uniref:EPT/RTPC-like protein n=1 Tax=Lophiostoma macrostomum CBS 122681 TaxID=1314788 RepID=A0A6A6TC32_9PLEO|nr:EPT/RTPC-like protein [Lophiostoma macrostomum CBS 122681]